MKLRDHLPKIKGEGVYIDDFTPKNTLYLFVSSLIASSH